MKTTINHALIIALGNFVLAIGVACFIIPNNILSGGVAGLAIALYPIFPNITPNMMITILTVGLFIVGGMLLGKKFFFKTLLSTVLYPLFLNLLTYLVGDHVFTDSVILASLYSGIFVGLGVGLVFRVDGSTGGMDIPALLMNKYLGMTLSLSCLILDGITVLLGITTYSIDAALVGLISVYSSSVLIDKTISFGGQKTKSVMIISDHYQTIHQKITAEIDRGVTLLEAVGGYTNDPKKVLLVVVLNKQYVTLNHLVTSIDPNAFMIVQDAHEVKGNGFSYFDE